MRRRVSIAVLVLLLPLALVGGIYLGGHPGLLPDPARDILVADSDAQLYEEAIDQIADDYYRPIDRRALLNAALEGAVDSLDDRFSGYFNPKTYADFKQSTSGAFVGIGVSVRDEKKLRRGLRVLTVYDGSPADRAGIEPGDDILSVNGRPTKGRSTEEITAMIRGRAGTSVRLSFGRPDPEGRPRTARVPRERVALPIVQGGTKRGPDGQKVAYASLASFTSGAHGELGARIKRQLKAGAKGVVLDLRDNGGGLLDEAVLVSSIFLDEGKVVTTRGRSKPERGYTATGGAIDSDVPVVVLVNDNSASASEIVAGALQDRKRARVVGVGTFGKGVFQEVKRLSNGGALDITVGSYFLPSGRNLGGGGVKQGKGVVPDVRAVDDEATDGRDEALEKALEVVTTPTAQR
jgi:carboxyl-terminal processing protease